MRSLARDRRTFPLMMLRLDMMIRRLIQAAILMLVALVLLVVYGRGFLMLLQGPADLYTLDARELEGRYVAARVDIIYDWYAESIRHGDETETPVRREYVIPAGSSAFIGADIPAGQFDDAQSVLDATLAAQQGQTFHPDGAEVVIQGTIQPMDAQTREYYYRVIGYDQLSPEDQQRFLPLVLVTDNIGGYPASSLTLGALAIAAFALPSIFLLLSARLSKGPRQPVAYLAAFPPAMQDPAQESLDAFYEESEPWNDCLRAGPEWVVWENGAASWILASRDIAWVYRQPAPPGARHSRIVVCSKSEPRSMARHFIPIRTPEDAAQVLELLYAALPGAVFGYDPRWEPLYRADPQRFCRDIRSAQETAFPSSAAPFGNRPHAPLYDAVRDAPDIFPPKPGAEPQPLEEPAPPQPEPEAVSDADSEPDAAGPAESDAPSSPPEPADTPDAPAGT